jgi:hypothetical protein
MGNTEDNEQEGQSHDDPIGSEAHTEKSPSDPDRDLTGRERNALLGVAEALLVIADHTSDGAAANLAATLVLLIVIRYRR